MSEQALTLLAKSWALKRTWKDDGIPCDLRAVKRSRVESETCFSSPSHRNITVLDTLVASSMPAISVRGGIRNEKRCLYFWDEIWNIPWLLMVICVCSRFSNACKTLWGLISKLKGTIVTKNGAPWSEMKKYGSY